jgi:tetratricopeptide (TPR) repeat protein
VIEDQQMPIRRILPTRYVAPAIAAALSACAPYPQRIHESPVLETGARLPAPPANGPGAAAAALVASDSPEVQNRRLADQLVQEGTDLLAANDLDGALNRFDRASVLRPDDKDLQYRVARLLDLQLRPKEALMRYQRFLNGLEIDKIKAQGEASAKMAEAIALAQQRIVVLEKQAGKP